MRPPTPVNDTGAALIILGVYAPESLHIGEIALALNPGVTPAKAHRYGASAKEWTRNRAGRIRIALAAVNDLLHGGYASVSGDGFVEATSDGVDLARTWGVKP